MGNDINEYDPLQAFLDREKARAASVAPRLIFALDATASRQPTWNEASKLQAEMFEAAGAGVEVQLVFFRGGVGADGGIDLETKECKSSPWLSDSRKLATMMRKIECIGGYTQIGRVLQHVLKESRKGKVRGLVYVGDAFETKQVIGLGVERGKAFDSLGEVTAIAADLGKESMPCFMFKETRNQREDERAAEYAFKKIAELSGGVACGFDAGSSAQLAELLGRVGKLAAIGGDPKQAIAAARKAIPQTLLLK